MKVGLIGLGKMDGFMGERFLYDKHTVIAFDLNADPVKDLQKKGAIGVSSINELKKNVPAPILTHSLIVRIRSWQEESFSAKILAALRNQFGGHLVRKI